MAESPSDLAPIGVFAYKRPEHLRRALESLARNSLASQSMLTVFCDGPRNAGEESLTRDVRRVAHERQWCREVRVVQRKDNLGLARSIIEGVTQLAGQHGRAIVIEDDLEVAPHFLAYMNRALELYEGQPRVMQISGYMFPVDEMHSSEARFLPLTTSWGWATWQRAWEQFHPDPWEDAQWLDNPAQWDAFDLGGAFPYSALLESQRQGKVDSWAIIWYHTVFARGGLVLYPPRSLVKNTGFDGSGTHCGASRGFEGGLAGESVESFPSEVTSDQATLARVAAYLAQTREAGGRGFHRGWRFLTRRILPLRASCSR